MNTSSLQFFSFLILLFCSTCTTTAQQPVAPDQPNILWLVAEDLSNYLPPFGDSTIQTPNLSRLAAEGICYDRFFSAAPVCAPARASIALGMYPSSIAASHMRTGPWYSNAVSDEVLAKYSKDQLPSPIVAYEAMPPPEARMVSETLRRAGYYCTNNAKQDYQFRCPVTAWDENGKEAHWRKRAPGQPFYSVFNFEVTHESQIWKKADDTLNLASDASVEMPPYLPDTEVARRDMRRMYSNVVEMDRQVGKVLAQLEEDGLLESTIIFWYTDHGGPLPRQKRLLYDSGLHVPMIIRFPDGRGAGTRSAQMTSFIDLAPTILSLTGQKTPPHMQGQAFLGKYADTARTYIHAAADRFDRQYDCNRAVRDERYKYIRYYQLEKSMFLHVQYRDQQPIMQELHRLREAGELTPEQALWFRDSKPAFEFFDTEADPHEMVNLGDDPQYASKIKELSDECDRWLEEINDRGLLPETELMKQIWPDGAQPETSRVVISENGGKLSMSCATQGASIGYRYLSRNDSEPWQVYQESFTPKEGENLEAIAQRIGYQVSGKTNYP